MELDFSSESSSGPIDSLDGHVDSVVSELSVISASSHSTIYKGKRYGQWYVLKGLSQEDCGNPIYEGLLEKEFLLTIGMNHPHIVHTYNFEYIQGVGNCIVMEYVDGTTLDEYLRTSPSESNRLRVTNQILSAMSYYHSMQIVHRDLKPKNILITRNGNNVKIIDFGLSDSDSYAVFKQPAGSAKYMAPEQWESSTQIDLRADIYSFGVIMRELMPSKYKSVADRCVREKREERYSTANEVQKAILSLQERRRSVARLIASIAVVCAIVAANIFLVRQYSSKITPTTIIRHSDTVIREVTAIPAISHTDTVVVYKTIPLRIDTVVKIKEVVPAEYAEVIEERKAEKERAALAQKKSEEICRWIDEQWAEFEKRSNSEDFLYNYYTGTMAIIMHSQTLITACDTTIAYNINQGEYNQIWSRSGDYMMRYSLKDKIPEDRLGETGRHWQQINDTIFKCMNRYSTILNKKNQEVMRTW